ncbi:MAG TPA: DUF2911 domain-containing protein [Chitinophagaceae bacterium]|jgi:hypothetical protein|nr:DUF2911 domain-containing protein [Chitinophagaceae bacterium]
MKQLLTTAIAVFTLLNMSAQQLTTPAPSPTQTIKQNFGLSAIELSYSRPSMKGRKIFGDLVPFGQVWRTGANAATTISFGDEVTINGTKIPAGKYGLLTIPGEKEWTIIISKQTDVTSPDAYKQDQDIVRVTVAPQTMPVIMETFTISFDFMKSNSCVLSILWDKTWVAFEITTDVDSKVMKSIDNIMNKDNKPYYAAASYYFDNGKDMSQALSWVNKAVEATPNAQPWVHTLKTRILVKLGKKEEAIAAANNAIRIAKETKYPEFVKQNEDILKTLK